MEKIEEKDIELDDGSLAYLRINVERELNYFHCDEIKQSKLDNKEFYILDYLKDIKTKFGNDRYLVKIKFNLEDKEALKFFTNSKDIKFILDRLRDINKFPRKVTLKSENGKNFYFT